MDKTAQAASHNLILEGREKLVISGVNEVDSFDENSVILSTSRGMLNVRGSGLKVEKLSIDGGEMVIRGVIDLMQYAADRTADRGSLLSRLFK